MKALTIISFLFLTGCYTVNDASFVTYVKTSKEEKKERCLASGGIFETSVYGNTCIYDVK